MPGRPRASEPPDQNVLDELVRAREENAQLKQALSSRTVIGQATGVLMATSSLAPEDAFAELVKRSSHANRKLRDVAADVVAAAHVDHQDTVPPTEQSESMLLLSKLASDSGSATSEP